MSALDSVSSSSTASSKRPRGNESDDDRKVADTSSKVSKVAVEPFSLFEMMDRLGDDLSGTVFSYLVDTVNEPAPHPLPVGLGEELQKRRAENPTVSQTVYLRRTSEEGKEEGPAITVQDGVMTVVYDAGSGPSTPIEHAIDLFKSELASQTNQEIADQKRASFSSILEKAYQAQPTICETAMAGVKRMRRRWPDMAEFTPSIRLATTLSCTVKPDDSLFSQFFNRSISDSFVVQDLRLDRESEDDNACILEAKPKMQSSVLKRVAVKSPSLTSLEIADAKIDFATYRPVARNRRVFHEAEKPSPELCFPRVNRVKFRYCNIDHTSALSAAFPSLRHLTFTDCAVRGEAFLTLLKGKEGLQSLVFNEAEFDPEEYTKELFMKIDDELIKQIVTLCPRLQEFAIELSIKGKITGEAFSAIAHLSELTSLNLFLKNSCQLRPGKRDQLEDLLYLGNCKKLVSLRLHFMNYHRGVIPQLVRELPALQSLTLQGRLAPVGLQQELEQIRPGLKVHLTKTGNEALDQRISGRRARGREEADDEKEDSKSSF